MNAHATNRHQRARSLSQWPLSRGFARDTSTQHSGDTCFSAPVSLQPAGQTTSHALGLLAGSFVCRHLYDFRIGQSSPINGTHYPLP
jgi:hypothetical protein